MICFVNISFSQLNVRTRSSYVISKLKRKHEKSVQQVLVGRYSACIKSFKGIGNRAIFHRYFRMANRVIVRRLLALTRSHSRRAYASHLPRLTSTQFSQIAQRLQSSSLRYCQLRSLSTTAGDQFVINIQDPKDFQEKVIDSKIPVVVDFHATWCGPCKLLGPRLETIIAGKKGKVILAKVDIDENADIAMRYGVQAVPTVLAIKNGTSIDKFVGLQDDDQIQTFVEKLC